MVEFVRWSKSEMVPGMTVQQVDEALAEWDRRLEAMAGNLLWLQSESTYELLTGSGGAARVRATGMTAARVDPALAALPALFRNFDLLHSTIGRAAEARKNLPAIFGSEHKLAEIGQLLRGRSIQLPVEDVPVESRTLLGAAEKHACVSPEELLGPMAGIFAAARDAVLAVERGWEELDRSLSRAEAEVDTLRQQGGGEELQQVVETMTRVRAQAQTDPLGALEEFAGAVKPALERVAAGVRARAQGRRDVEAARAQMQALRALHAEALAAVDEARRKIADCGGLPAPCVEQRLTWLGKWLERVERWLGDGAMDRFEEELRNWRTSADACMAETQQVLGANRAPVETRRELRGRLDALKAKARGRGVAEAEGVAALARQAEMAVAAYAKSLNGGSAQ